MWLLRDNLESNTIANLNDWSDDRLFIQSKRAMM